MDGGTDIFSGPSFLNNQGMAFAGFIPSRAVTFQHGYLMAPALQLVRRGYANHAGTNNNDVHALLPMTAM